MFVPLTIYLQWYTKELQQYEKKSYHNVFSNLLPRPKTKVSDKNSNDGDLRNFPFSATRKFFVIHIYNTKISHIIVLYTDY